MGRPVYLPLLALGWSCTGKDDTTDTGTPTDTDADADTDTDADTDADTDTDTEIPAEVSLTSFDGEVQTDLAFVAFQDGDGPWEEVAGLGGRYTFPVGGPRYGVSWVCVEPIGFVRVFSIQALSTEVAEHTVHCTATDPTVPVSGTVSGLAANEYAQITIGRAYTSASSGNPVYDTLAYPGANDLLARRDTPDGVDALLIRRNLSLFSAATLDLDFADSVALEPYDVEIANLGPNESGGANAVFWTTLGASSYLWRPDSLPGVPASEMIGNDIQAVTASGYDGVTGLARKTTRYLRAPVDLSLSLPALVGPPALAAVATVPYVRLSATVSPSDARVHELLVLAYPSASVFWTVWATDGWLEEGGTDEVALPDLSAAPSWLPAWGLPAGPVYAWYYQAIDGTSPDVDVTLGTLRYEPPAPGMDGIEITSVQHSGQIQP